jgi:LuxR family maltose regulon positive regulatory protein
VLQNHPEVDGPGEPLLVSKLAVPPLPGSLVTRPRLHGLLDTGAGGPLTVLVAPAGWGKTVLLSTWARERGRTGWLALEPDDAGGRFWWYLHAALDSAGVPGPLPVPGSGGYLTELADTLAGLAEPAVVVLDDFHHVHDPDVLDGLEFLVRHAASGLRLVIATRADPALPLHRLRLRDELTELRTAELSFTAAETARLLGEQEVALPAPALQALQAHTEGWPAGVRFAALSLREHPDPARFIGHFAGDDATVAEYLIGEVFEDQSPGIQETMVDTSILQRLCGGLVEALTGRDDGDQVLAELSRTNTFVVPLESRPSWFRYHRMFGELLRARLHRQAPERIAELHRRAARWHAGEDQPVDALRHALTAQDWGYATGLLVERWHHLARYGHDEPLPALVEPPPADAIRADPELALAYAADRLDLRDLDTADGYLRLADRHRHLLDEPRRDRFSLITAALQLAQAQQRGDPAQTRQAATAMLDLLGPARAWTEPAWTEPARTEPARTEPARTEPARTEPGPDRSAGPAPAAAPGLAPAAQSTPAAGIAPAAGVAPAAQSTPAAGLAPAAETGPAAIALAALGTAELTAGNLDAAEAALRAGLAHAEAAGLSCPRLVCASTLAFVQAVRGKLRAAQRTAQAALGMPPCAGQSRAVHRGYAYLALAVVDIQWDRLDRARSELDFASGACEPGSEPALAGSIAVVTAQLLHEQGDLAKGYEALSAGRRELADRPPSAFLEQSFAAVEADLRTAHGDAETVRRLLSPPADGEPAIRQPRPDRQPAPVPDPAVAVTLAHAYLRDDDPGSALRTLPAWHDDTGAPLPLRLSAGLVEALAARRTGDARRASRTLEKVLRLAEPEGFRRVFTRAGAPARELLIEHLDSGTACWSLVNELVAAGERPLPAGPGTPMPAMLAEPLTERELTVLRYLQSILSNTEIAVEMSLSVNTVKTHVRNIYRKLDAARRRDAVRRARELHLL